MFDFEKGRIRFLRGGKYPHCHGIFIDDQIRTFIDPASDEKKLLAIRSTFTAIWLSSPKESKGCWNF
jgi:hypothetical protein